MPPRRARVVDLDVAFDLQLPRRIQMKSAIHFTPVAVARYAAHWLAPRDGMRVLDVGAGPGKFCIIAARERPRCTFVGVELRSHLVHTARKLAQRLEVGNVEFLEGDALAIDWSTYDAFYFYNPFGEQIHETAHIIDRTINLDPATFQPSVASVGERLRAARLGTRVVTYHGFGAQPPDGYDLVDRHPIGSDTLELWVKVRDA
jgi:predicted RNA methylase